MSREHVARWIIRRPAQCRTNLTRSLQRSDGIASVTRDHLTSISNESLTIFNDRNGNPARNSRRDLVVSLVRLRSTSREDLESGRACRLGRDIPISIGATLFGNGRSGYRAFLTSTELRSTSTTRTMPLLTLMQSMANTKRRSPLPRGAFFKGASPRMRSSSCGLGCAFMQRSST